MSSTIVLLSPKIEEELNTAFNLLISARKISQTSYSFYYSSENNLENTRSYPRESSVFHVSKVYDAEEEVTPTLKVFLRSDEYLKQANDYVEIDDTLLPARFYVLGMSDFYNPRMAFDFFREYLKTKPDHIIGFDTIYYFDQNQFNLISEEKYSDDWIWEKSLSAEEMKKILLSSEK